MANLSSPSWVDSLALQLASEVMAHVEALVPSSDPLKAVQRKAKVQCQLIDVILEILNDSKP